jgi:hypothetical protein
MKNGGAYQSRNWELPHFRASYFTAVENNNMSAVYRHDSSRDNVSDFRKCPLTMSNLKTGIPIDVGCDFRQSLYANAEIQLTLNWATAVSLPVPTASQFTLI